jgi:DNA modification methylase
MTLIQGDCLIEMAKLKDDSIDLLFCDLPYAQTSCHWDCAIDLTKFWAQVNRICKDTTPMFFTCSTKFGVTLINSNPKNFRYDMVWVKSAPCGFLNAKKMPMKKHEMLYVFYRKLPLYDISSHKHKFLKEATDQTEPSLGEETLIRGRKKKTIVDIYNVDEKINSGKMYHNSRKCQKGDDPVYDPPLPISVLRQSSEAECYDGNITYNYEDREGPVYDPPLPNTILEIKSERGKHATQKPTALIEWCLKYYSKEGDTVLDPTMGSGSTGVACAKMNRKFIGIEMDPAIFESAKKRI